MLPKLQYGRRQEPVPTRPGGPVKGFGLILRAEQCYPVPALRSKKTFPDDE
jgi:hypothetical protein